MGNECGPGGSQSRAVWCAHSEGWTTLHTNCEQATRPHNQQGCFRVCDWHKDMYDWQLGAWNQCVPVAMRSSAGAQRYAAVVASGVCTRGEEGIQTREVACVQKTDAAPAEDTICEYFEPKPRLEQACLIPCPRDCVVSQFSHWTSCSKTCGTGLQNRIRSVLAPPLFGGAACPNLTEFQTCQPGLCEASRDKTSRDSDTSDRGGDKLPRDSDTPALENPAREKGKKAAKGNVKLDREADKLARANRKLRKLIRKQERASRQVDRPKRQKKPKNKEKREKIREKARERLRSEKRKAKDPETRELLKKKRTKNRQNRPGGKSWDIQMGYQTREVTCIHKSGDTEALSLCSQDSLPVTYQACVMTKDCEVSSWSEWSACSKQCYDPNGPKGERVRTRRVSQFTVGHDGAECPELEEKEACSPGDGAPPCTVYSWKATEWTECRVDTLLSQQDRRRSNQTGLCGGGVQGREIYCVQASADTPSNLSALRSREDHLVPSDGDTRT
ncbi:hypothetical protein CRUP_022083 [Coryphaenoides rupestris]|nr:hypothetical protein CRUP_022083 [Coryphaenoides rupestris]